MTAWRAALISGLVALGCYIGALQNDWAMDDEFIISANPAAQSIDQALENFFEPYWPEESGLQAGQYRPLAVLWFSVDWMISGGNPSWFHGVNVVLHAIGTMLFVFVTARWLPPFGALMAGLVFAVHPVHVEAVANIVGRTEVATAVGLLGALLCARRFRSSSGWRASFWLVGVLSLFMLSLLTKENAVVFLALLVLDELAESGAKGLIENLAGHIPVIVVTLAWLYLWRGVAGQFVVGSETAALRDTGHLERLSTMLPAYLDVSRLLFWPMDLAPDYNPQMIPRRSAWSLPATFVLIQTIAILWLTWLLRKRALAITVAISASFIVYVPASNLFFASGVLLAERSLYLAVWAPAVIAGWLTCSTPTRRARIPVTVALSLALLLFAVRTVQRVPEWQSTERILTDAFVEDAENYRGHLRIGTLLAKAGDSTGALAQSLAAAEIFPDDPFVTLVTSTLASNLGYPELALREAERGFRNGVEYPELVRSAVRARLALGMTDSALAAARIGVELHPMAPMASQSYIEVLRSIHAEPWRLAYAQARHDWIHGQLGVATQNLLAGSDAVVAGVVDSSECWDIERALPLLEALLARRAIRLREEIAQNGSCGRF